MSWIFYSISATLLFGIGGTLYKLPANRGDGKLVTTFYSMFVPFVISLVAFRHHLTPITPALIWTSIGWACFFLVVRLLYIESYHRNVDTNALTPITGALSLIGSVAIGIVAFHDRLSHVQWIGVALALLAVVLFLWQRKSLSFSRVVVWLSLLIPVFSLAYKTVQKIATNHVDIYAFQTYSFGIGALLALILFAAVHRKGFAQFFQNLHPQQSLSGFLIGCVSFLGGILYLLALQKGPFALVSTIHALNILVTAVCSAIVFKEKLNQSKVGLIALAIIAAILIS